jgi:hypothetical protein
LRAGELTAVRVPDPPHEAMRNLIRARTAASGAHGGGGDDPRPQAAGSAFLLRHSRIFLGFMCAVGAAGLNRTNYTIIARAGRGWGRGKGNSRQTLCGRPVRL